MPWFIITKLLFPTDASEYDSVLMSSEKGMDAGRQMDWKMLVLIESRAAQANANSRLICSPTRGIGGSFDAGLRREKRVQTSTMNGIQREPENQQVLDSYRQTCIRAPNA
jgi:hypothetical protein